jgi:hypothetical protein
MTPSILNPSEINVNRSILARLAVIALAALLGGVLAGCVSDTGATLTGVGTGDSPTLRYHGGPKYPMSPN